MPDQSFNQWPDCCRRVGHWSRVLPRLFACPTCGVVMHTKVAEGELHHQRVHPGSELYKVHPARSFTESDKSEFGMYLLGDRDDHRDDPYWPHYSLDPTRTGPTVGFDRPEVDRCGGQRIGPTLDSLGLTVTLDQHDQITEALVIAKITDFETGSTSLGIYFNEGMDWIARLGLLEAARQVLADGEFRCKGQE